METGIVKGTPEDLSMIVGELGAHCYGNDSFILIEDADTERAYDTKKIVTLRLFKLREGSKDTQYVQIYLSSASAEKSHLELRVKAVGKGMIDRRWRIVAGWLKGSTVCF